MAQTITNIATIVEYIDAPHSITNIAGMFEYAMPAITNIAGMYEYAMPAITNVAGMFEYKYAPLPPSPIPHKVFKGKSHKENRGISIFLSNPPFNDLLTGTYEEITQFVVDYSHTISANVGFDTATAKVHTTREKIDEYAEKAIGRKLSVYNEGANLVWEGFVNSIKYNYGGQETTRGPLLDIANRVSVSYAPLDITTSPITTGPQTYTTIVEDTNSQAKWGILETIVSGGTLLDADAINIGDLFLAENSSVTTSNTISVSQNSKPEMSFECLGYYHWFEKYVYNSAALATITISDRIKNIIDYNPNTVMYSPDYQIDDNAWLIIDFDDSNKTAATHIKELLAYGDASDNRFTLGCYEDRVFKYRSLPTEYEYFMSAAVGGGSILTRDNSVVRHWDVRPSKWLLITDMLIGNVPTSTPLSSDPRSIFIEKVQYSIPYGLTINGEKISTFKQRLQAFAGLGSF